MDNQLAENQNRHQLVQKETNYKQQVQNFVRQSSTQFVQTSTSVNQVTKTATKAVVQQNVLNTESDDYKQQINSAQRKFLDLEEELKSTRSKLGTLNRVCANTEEKIGALKNLEGTYQESYTTVIQQNGASKANNKQLETISVHLKSGQQTFVSEESYPCERAEQVSMAFPHELESEAVNELKVIVKKLNDENEQLHEQLQNLRRDKDFTDSHCQSEIESLKKQVSMLEGQLQQTDYTQLQRTQQLQDALRECEEKRGEALKTIEVFRSQVAAYDKRIEGLDASLVQTRTRNADLEKKMSSFPRRLRELERDLNCAIKDKESKEKKLKELNSRVLVLEQELSEAHLEKERFRLQITENQNKVDLKMKLRSEQLSDAQLRCQMLQKEAEDKEKNIEQLVKEKTKIGTELYALKSQLAKKETNECEELNTLKDEVIEWKKRYDVLKIQDGDLKKKNNLLLRENQELKEKINQSEDRQKRENQHLQELISSEKQCKEQIVAQEEETVKLLREIENMQNTLSERDEELGCRKEEVLFLGDEAQKWRLGYEDVLKSQGESSRGSEEEKSFLRRENDTLKELVQQLQDDIQTQLKEKEPLTKKNETLKRQHDRLQAEMVELKREKEFLFSNKKDLQEQTYRLQEKLSTIGKNYESILQESNYLKEKLREYENSRSEIVISLEQEIATIRNREAKLQKEHIACRTDIEKLTNKNGLLRKELHEQANGHNKNNANLKKETELLQRKLSSLQQELFSVRKETDTLDKENSSLKTMLKEDEELHGKDKVSLQRRITNLENNIERLQKEINRLRTEKESLILEGKKLKIKMEKQKETSEKQRNDLQQQIALLQEEADKFHTDMAVVVKENDCLSTERETLIKENDDLRRLRDNETSSYDQEKESLQSSTAMLEKKINKLQRDSDDLNKQISSLKNKNENLKMILEKEKISSKANMDDYAMENEKLRKKMDDQKNLFADENTKFKKELVGITKEKESLLQHVCSLEEKTNVLNKELKNLRNTLEEERRENKNIESSLREKIAFLQEEVEKLQHETTDNIKKMDYLLMEKEYLLREKDRLQKCLDEKKRTSDQYNEERVLLVEEKDEMEQQLTALKDQNINLEKELSTIREGYLSIKKECENHKQEIIILETQLATARKDLEKEQVKKENAREELERQLVFLQQRNHEMKDEMSRLQNDLDEKSKISDDLKRENADVSKTLAEKSLVYKNSQDNLQCQITKLKEDIDTVTMEKDHLRSENVHLENQKSTCRDQIATMNQKLTDLQKEMDRLTKNNKELKSHIVTTQSELEEQSQRHTNVQKEKETQVSSCRDQISILEKELAKTQQDFAILLQENDSLKVDLKTVQEETKIGRDNKENYQRKIDSLQEQITRMKSGLTNAQTEKDFITKENKDLKRQVHVIEERFATVNKELSQVQMEEEYQAKQNDELKRQITAFRDQIARLNKDFLNLQNEKENLTKENKNLKSQLVVLQENISKVNKEFSNFQAERDYLINEKEELYEALKRERALYKRDKEAFEKLIKVLQENIDKVHNEKMQPAVEEQVFCKVEDTVDAAPDEHGGKLQELQDSFDNYREEQERKASNLSATITGLEDELASLKKLKKSLNDELLAFRNSLQLKQEQLASANERNNQLKAELTNKEQTITELRRKVTRLTELEVELSQCQEQSEELVRAREEILYLKDARQDDEFLRQIMSEIENDRDKLRKEKNKLQEKVDLLNEELMHLKSLQPQLKEKDQMLSNLQNDKNAQINNLTQRINELESRHTLVEKTTIIETESRIMIKQKEIRELKERFDAKCNECEHHLKELEDARSMNAELKIDQAWKPRYESLKLHYKELEKENSLLKNKKQNTEKQLEIFWNKTTKPEKHMQEHDNSKELTEESTNVVDGKFTEDEKKTEALQKELERVKQELLNKDIVLLSYEKQLRSLRLETDIKETKINRINEEKENLQARIVELEYKMNQPKELQLSNNSLDNDVRALRSRNQELETEITSLRAQLETKIETIEEIRLEKVTLVTQITELEKTVANLKEQIEDTDKVVFADLNELESQPVSESTKSLTLNIDVQGHHEAVRFEVLRNELDSIVTKPREVSTLFVPIRPVSSVFEHQEITINSEQDQEEKVIVVPVTPVNSQTPKVGDSEIVAVLVKVRENESDNLSVSSSFTSGSAQINFISEEDTQDEIEEPPSDKQVGPLRYKFEYPKQGPTALPLVRGTPPIKYPTEILDVQPGEDPQIAIRKSSQSAAERECFVEPDLYRDKRRPTQQFSEPKKQVPVKERVRRANTEPVFTHFNPEPLKNAPDSKKSFPSIAQDEEENEFRPDPTDVKLDGINGAFNPVPKTRSKNKGILTVEQYDVPPDPNNDCTPTKKPHRFSLGNINTKYEALPQSPLKISFLGVEKNQPDPLPVQDVHGKGQVPERSFTRDVNPRLGRRTMSLGVPLKRNVPDGYASDSSADYYRPSTRPMQSTDQQKRRKTKKKKGLLQKIRNSEQFKTISNDEPVMSFDI